MYVAVVHTIKDKGAAFARGEQLIKNEGAPAGARVLEFYPSGDGSAVTCLWEAPSVESIQGYVDEVLGDASRNLCFEVDTDKAFGRRASGIRESATPPA